MLRSKEAIKRYSADFAMVEIDYGYRQGKDVDDPRSEINRYNPERYRPVFVFLDAEGKVVLKTMGGFNNQMEMAILSDFISGKHYARTTWKAYLAEKLK